MSLFQTFSRLFCHCAVILLLVPVRDHLWFNVQFTLDILLKEVDKLIESAIIKTEKQKHALSQSAELRDKLSLVQFFLHVTQH